MEHINKSTEDVPCKVQDKKQSEMETLEQKAQHLKEEIMEISTLLLRLDIKIKSNGSDVSVGKAEEKASRPVINRIDGVTLTVEEAISEAKRIQTDIKKIIEIFD